MGEKKKNNFDEDIGWKIDRRDFIKYAGAMAGALAMSRFITPTLAKAFAQAVQAGRAGRLAGPAPGQTAAQASQERHKSSFLVSVTFFM